MARPWGLDHPPHPRLLQFVGELIQILPDRSAWVDATNGAASSDVASGKTYWGLTETGWRRQRRGAEDRADHE